MRNNTVDIVPHICYIRAMKYLRTYEIANKWGISDRRVRTLCKDGRIPGVLESDTGYLIPCDALKPADGRCRVVSEDFAEYGAKAYSYYLKWQDSVVAGIDSQYRVHFFEPRLNSVVAEYTHGDNRWSREQFEAFLNGRILSSSRRDIEQILFRCGLTTYDTIQVALATRAINARDLLWIANSYEERMANAISEAFESIFYRKIDLQGDIVDTPEGQNVKRFAVSRGRYGIIKKRLSPLSTDVESEVAVYELAKRLGVKCCPAWREGEDVFSAFEYDYGKDNIVHVRRLFEGLGRGSNEFHNLISIRPQYQADWIRMIALDFITRQDDRHLSNMAVKISKEGESFYPLYDNGRSLFYEDSEETASRACEDIRLYSTSFGPSGTYYDYICEIAESGVDFSRLIDLTISDEEVREILEEAGFSGYRMTASLQWIRGCLDILKCI